MFLAGNVYHYQDNLKVISIAFIKAVFCVRLRCMRENCSDTIWGGELHIFTLLTTSQYQITRSCKSLQLVCILATVHLLIFVLLAFVGTIVTILSTAVNTRVLYELCVYKSPFLFFPIRFLAANLVF